MNRKNKLSSILHLITSISFWFSIAFLIFNIILNLFFENSEIKTGKYSKISTPKGYVIPLQLNLSLRQDGYNYISNKGSITVLDNKSLKEQFYDFKNIKEDRVKEIIENHTKKIRTGSKLEITDLSGNQPLKFSNKILPGKISMFVTSEHTFLSILLFINQHYRILITIFILYFLKAIFSNLKNNLTFNNKIARHTKLIGLLITLKQVLGLILSFVIGSSYNLISINSETNYNNAFNLSLNPTLEFNFSMFIVGLSLLVVSILLNKGNNLQTENELTI